MPYFGPPSGSISAFDYHAPKTGHDRGLVGNLLQDVQDFATGLGPGLGHILEGGWHDAGNLLHGASSGYELDDIGRAIFNDYKHVYGPALHGDFGTTAHRIKLHPLGPILDVLSLISGGAGVLGKAGKISAKVGGSVKGAKIAGYAHVGHLDDLLHDHEFIKSILPQKLGDNGLFHADPKFLVDGELEHGLAREEHLANLPGNEELLGLSKAKKDLIVSKTGDVFKKDVTEVAPKDGAGRVFEVGHSTNPYTRMVRHAYAKVGAQFPHVPMVGLHKRIAKADRVRTNRKLIAESRQFIEPVVEKHFKDPAHQELAKNLLLTTMEGVDPEHADAALGRTADRVSKHAATPIKRLEIDQRVAYKIANNPAKQAEHHAAQYAKYADRIAGHDRFAKMGKKRLVDHIARNSGIEDPNKANLYRRSLIVKDKRALVEDAIKIANRGKGKGERIPLFKGVETLRKKAAEQRRLHEIAKRAVKDPDAARELISSAKTKIWHHNNADTMLTSIAQRRSILSDPKMRAVLEWMHADKNGDLSQLQEALAALTPHDRALVESFERAGGKDKVRQMFSDFSKMEQEGTTRNYEKIAEIEGRQLKVAPEGFDAEARRYGPLAAYDEALGIEHEGMSDAEIAALNYSRQSHFLEELGYKTEGLEHPRAIIRPHRSELPETKLRREIYDSAPHKKIVHQTQYLNVTHALDHWDLNEVALVYHRSLATHAALRNLKMMLTHAKVVPHSQVGEQGGWQILKAEGGGHLTEHIQSMLDFINQDAKAIFGDVVDSADVDGLAKSLEQLLNVEGGKVYMVPGGVAKVLQPEIIRSTSFIHRFWDNPSRWWRNWTLGLRPAWMVNNLIGNLMLMWTSQGVYNGTRSFLQLMTDKELRGAIAAKTGDLKQSGFSRSMIEQAMREKGVKGTDSLARAQLELIKNPNNLAEYVIEKNAQWLEDPLRRTAFWAEMRRPAIRLAKELDITPAKAAEMMLDDDAFTHHMTTKVLGDMVNFRDMSDLERTWVRRAIPFYAWLKGITATTGKMVEKDPLKADILAHWGQYGHKQGEQTFGEHPEFFNSFMGVGKPKDGKLSTINTLSWNPYSTVGDIVGMTQPFLPGGGGGGLQGTQNPLNSLNPAIKATLETATGNDLFFGGPLNELRKPTTDFRTGATTGGDPEMNRAVLWLRRYALQYPQVRAAEKATRTPSSHPLFNDTPGSQLSQYLGFPRRSVNLDEVHSRGALERSGG